MKNLTLILLILTSFNLFGQETEPTLEETQKWIISVVHTYGTGELEFNNGKIIYDDPYDPTGFHIRHEAQINIFGGVKIGSGTKGYKAVYIACATGKCVNVGMKMQGKYDDFDYMENSTFMIQLNDDITEDLEERLINAFNHLIKLYGGNTIDNTF